MKIKCAFTLSLDPVRIIKNQIAHRAKPTSGSKTWRANAVSRSLTLESIPQLQRTSLILPNCAQGQANKWVKNMEGKRGLKVLNLQMSDMVRQMEMALQMGSPVLLQDIEVRGFWVSCVCMHVCVCACACARAFALVCARAANGLTSPAAGHRGERVLGPLCGCVCVHSCVCVCVRSCVCVCVCVRVCVCFKSAV